MSQLSAEEFAERFREAYPRLWTVAVAMIGDKSRAEDLVQDAAMTAMRRLDDFSPGTNFAAWMSQIVRYNALNELKQRKRRKSEAFDLHAIAVKADSSHDRGDAAVTADGLVRKDQHEFDDHVLTALDTIEPQRRACLLLRVVHGLPYEEIAEVIGVPRGTAMSHVHRAKAAMRAALSRDEPAEESREARDG
ncbi:MAG: RNA polymerase sigma factor [Planctomycetota bacterium]